jgi:hypothetical protein
MIPSLSNHGGLFIVFSLCLEAGSGSDSFLDGWDLEVARLLGCKLHGIEPGEFMPVRKL